MNLNFFTQRERVALDGIPRDGKYAGPVNIEQMKIEVAKRFPSADWDAQYLKLQSFANALVKLAEYNTCTREDGWVWYAPHTPNRIFEVNRAEPIDVFAIVHPKRLNDYVELVLNRTPEEREEYVAILQTIRYPGIQNIRATTPDKNGVFTKLTWVAGPFNNANIFYIHRGRH